MNPISVGLGGVQASGTIYAHDCAWAVVDNANIRINQARIKQRYYGVSLQVVLTLSCRYGLSSICSHSSNRPKFELPVFNVTCMSHIRKASMCSFMGPSNKHPRST